MVILASQCFSFQANSVYWSLISYTAFKIFKDSVNYPSSTWAIPNSGTRVWHLTPLWRIIIESQSSKETEHFTGKEAEHWVGWILGLLPYNYHFLLFFFTCAIFSPILKIFAISVSL